MRLEQVNISVGDYLSQSDFKDVFGQGATGKGIEIRYDDKGQKYLWLFAKEEGRYDDDIGSKQFRFTGENPQGHGVENSGEEDQELNRGNETLRNAIDTSVPIFLFYRAIDSNKWEYRGMVEVTNFNYKPSGGRYIYEFLLEPVKDSTKDRPNIKIDTSEQTADLQQSSRTQTTVSRIIRNTRLIKEIKNRYDHTCQVCGDQRRGNDGEPYAEGHHIQPIGRPHNGKDEKSNILVLCPNHHVDFDYGRIKIDPQTYQIQHADEPEVNGAQLAIEKNHNVENRYIRYHNEGLAQF